MMSQGRNRILRCRETVRISNRSERRGPDGGSVERKQRLVTEPVVVHGRNFHEEVVRMLSIYDWLGKCRLSLLEEQRILPLRNRRRLKAEHRAQSKAPLP